MLKLHRISNLLQNNVRRLIPRSVYLFAKNTCRYVASLRYLGNKYQCPFCNGKFNMLLPAGIDIAVLKEKQVIGGGYRLNSTCPRCLSGDRERNIYLYLKKTKQCIFTSGIKLLHIAPEENLGLKLKSCPNIDYLSGDINSTWVDLQMDITDIKQNNDVYDVIICNHVFEHIQDDIGAMRELYRVLKKGGFAILQVPISYLIERTVEDPEIKSPQEKRINFGQEDHVRIYGKDYVMRLNQAGFTVDVVDCVKEFGLEDVLKYGLLENEKIFLCSK